ncbi:unnamed protein product [Bursaphelenchus okinawaensis]|uniref:Uncharacterized protein n=1 Tax=Bursaphelenchus okinawaensis TaxID=465554 RepID=A0A811KQN8_9BILA|nr:unnamed protein product [Bursaphelenchus okinawaensis]CAG9108147.1 unnamed protein product [Bursaphelenchus okinawaensis]
MPCDKDKAKSKALTKEKEEEGYDERLVTGVQFQAHFDPPEAKGRQKFGLKVVTASKEPQKRCKCHRKAKRNKTKSDSKADSPPRSCSVRTAKAKNDSSPASAHRAIALGRRVPTQASSVKTARDMDDLSDVVIHPKVSKKKKKSKAKSKEKKEKEKKKRRRVRRRGISPESIPPSEKTAEPDYIQLATTSMKPTKTNFNYTKNLVRLLSERSTGTAQSPGTTTEELTRDKLRRKDETQFPTVDKRKDYGTFTTSPVQVENEDNAVTARETYNLPSQHGSSFREKEVMQLPSPANDQIPKELGPTDKRLLDENTVCVNVLIIKKGYPNNAKKPAYFYIRNRFVPHDRSLFRCINDAVKCAGFSVKENELVWRTDNAKKPLESYQRLRLSRNQNPLWGYAIDNENKVDIICDFIHMDKIQDVPYSNLFDYQNALILWMHVGK